MMLCNHLWIDWQSKVERHTKHIIGHIGDGFLRVKWPSQQCQSHEYKYGYIDK